VESKLGSGSGEEAVAEVLEEAALHGVLGEGGAIDVGAVGFIADDESLIGHDLHELKDRGIARGLLLIKGVMNVPYGGRFLLPEDLEQFEFGFGGAGDGRTVIHDGVTVYEGFRNCQRKSSYL